MSALIGMTDDKGTHRELYALKGKSYFSGSRADYVDQLPHCSTARSSSRMR